MDIAKKKKIEWLIFSFLGLVSVISGSLLFYQISYAGKIYPNVSIAGINVGGKTKTQASFLIEKKYEEVLNDDIILKAESKEVKTKLADTGLTLDTENIVENALSIGRDDRFFNQIANSAQTIWKTQSVPILTEIDKGKYDSFLQIAVSQLNQSPQDASLKIENGEIVEVSEQSGLQVETDDLVEKIMNAAEASDERLISLNSNPIEPSVKTANFTEAKAKASEILNKKITLTYESQTFSPSRIEIGGWINFTANGNTTTAVVNDSSIQAYINKIAKNIEVVKKDRKVNAMDGAVLEEGQPGKLLNKDEALTSIKNQLNSTNQDTIVLATHVVDPAEVKVFPSEGLVPGRFEGKYIDVDLTIQKLCMVEGPNVAGCFIISSGKPGMATPTGTYLISEKNPRHWSSRYHMWLPYWQRFIDEGYGIHELPETNTWKETDAHLGTPVSHGCVRLGVGPAETVYNFTSIGTPIYIHK